MTFNYPTELFYTDSIDLGTYRFAVNIPIELNITEYGAVGGKIKGTFNGILSFDQSIFEQFNYEDVDPIVITNGKFCVKRGEDWEPLYD